MNKLLFALLALLSLSCQRKSGGVRSDQSVYFYERRQYSLPPSIYPGNASSSGVINWEGRGSETVTPGSIPYIYNTDGVVEPKDSSIIPSGHKYVYFYPRSAVEILDVKDDMDTLQSKYAGWVTTGNFRSFSSDFPWYRAGEIAVKVSIDSNSQIYSVDTLTVFTNRDTVPLIPARDPNSMHPGFKTYRYPDPDWVDTLEWQTQMYRKYRLLKHCPVDTSSSIFRSNLDTIQCPGRVMVDTILYNFRLDSCLLTALVWVGEDLGVRQVHIKYIARFDKHYYIRSGKDYGENDSFLYNVIPYNIFSERLTKFVHIMSDGRAIKPEYILKVLKSDRIK